MIDNTSILNRLNRLERTNRRLKFAGVLACTLAGAALLMGQASQPSKRVVEAEEFRVVDRDGTLRGKWEVEMGGNVAMRLYGLHQSGQLVLDAASAGNVSVILFGRLQEIRGSWATTASGSIGLAQFGKAETIRGMFWVGNDGETYLELKDKDGTSRARLGSTDLVTTKTGMKTKTAESSLVLFDKESNVIWRAPPR